MKVSKTILLSDIDQTARDVVAHIESSVQLTSATVVALSGDLGAGKTTLTQAIARVLGITERLQSPTFVILKKYEIKSNKFTHLIHIDAYRLKSGQELQKLNWQEYVSNPKNLIIIEWPEQVSEILPKQMIRIRLEHVSEHERCMELE